MGERCRWVFGVPANRSGCPGGGGLSATDGGIVAVPKIHPGTKVGKHFLNPVQRYGVQMYDSAVGEGCVGIAPRGFTGTKERGEGDVSVGIFRFEDRINDKSVRRGGGAVGIVTRGEGEIGNKWQAITWVLSRETFQRPPKRIRLRTLTPHSGVSGEKLRGTIPQVCSGSYGCGSHKISDCPPAPEISLPFI